MGQEGLIFIVSNVGLVLIIAAILISRRAKVERRNAARLAELKEAGFVQPPTLHPVIDPTLCIGSGSCTLACPQGNDVLGLISGRGTLLDPTACIGHGRCAAECPTGAIRLVFGTSERGVDIPHLQKTFETNVPGLFITGELGGMGLIANAVRQTREAMEHVARRAAALASTVGECADVAIVGAGPAGLTAALCAMDSGLSYRLLDRESTLGGSILHYPRRKVVLTSPVELPRVGKIHSQRMSKEDLLALWQGIVAEHGIAIEGGILVSDVRPNGDGTFTVITNGGEIRARTVLLCLGRRGTPRKLGVPGEELAKVAYCLREPEVFAGRDVLVVGGGDSAIEAACTLAEETDARVTLSYRRGAINRAKPENLRRLKALEEAERIALIYNSELARIEARSVALTVGGGERTITNDDVLIFAGGEMPVGLLQRAGIRLERQYGEETEADRDGSSADKVFDRIRRQTRAKELRELRKAARRKVATFPLALFALGAAIVLGLFLIGGDYYLTPEPLRSAQPELEALAPTGMWGQTVGALALVFMFTNFIYFVRKEFAFMKGVGSIHSWMNLHLFSGLMSGIVVLFHSALFMRNLFAVALYLSLGIVIGTGLIGRYLYTFVPTDPRGRPLAREALQHLSDSMAVEFGRLFDRLVDTAEIRRVLQEHDEPPPSLAWVFVALFVTWPRRFLRLRRLVKRAGASIKSPRRSREFERYAREMLRIRFEMDYLPHLKRLLGLWRIAHAVLAFLLIFLVTAHIAVEVWVGYRWIF